MHSPVPLAAPEQSALKSTVDDPNPTQSDATSAEKATIVLKPSTARAHSE